MDDEEESKIMALNLINSETKLYDKNSMAVPEITDQNLMVS